MILEIVLNLIKSLLLIVINLLPTVETFSLPVEMMAWVTNIFSSVAWIVPIDRLMPIFVISFALTNFELVKNIFFRLWDSLPFT